MFQYANIFLLAILRIGSYLKWTIVINNSIISCIETEACEKKSFILKNNDCHGKLLSLFM